MALPPESGVVQGWFEFEVSSVIAKTTSITGKAPGVATNASQEIQVLLSLLGDPGVLAANLMITW